MERAQTQNPEQLRKSVQGASLWTTLLIISLISLVTRGLELGIDFQGGMEFVVESQESLSPTAVRADRTALANVIPSRLRARSASWLA